MSRAHVVLITGGAGYVGSAVAHWIQQAGFLPCVVDDLSSGNADAVHPMPFYPIDLTEGGALSALDSLPYEVDAVVHCAAKTIVSESVRDPFFYWNQNIRMALTTASFVQRRKIPILLNSSTCAVYDSRTRLALTEDAPLLPVSPYAETKLACEKIFSALAAVLEGKTRILNFRYFNPAGALASMGIGERHSPETHLIPSLALASLQEKPFTVFGTDYSTRDGTCEKDIFHIEDLCEAHVLALRYLMHRSHAPFDTLNLGFGRAVSVASVVKVAQNLWGESLKLAFGPRRPGDIPYACADITKAKHLLGFRPQHDLKRILTDDYTFRRRLHLQV